MGKQPMSTHNLTARHLRGVAMGLATMVTVAAGLPVPAGAQFFDDRYPGAQYGRRAPPQSHGFFPFFNGDRYQYDRPYDRPYVRPPAPVESTKAPPPKKLETPPTSTVVVIGDSLADWLAYGLEETFSDSPDIGVVRKIRPTSGLIRYEPRNETLEWSQAVKDILAAEKPSAIVVMLGLNDRISLRDRAPPSRPGQAANQPQRDSAPAKPATPPDPAAVPPAQAQTDSEQPAAAAGEAQHTQNGSYEFHTDKWAELYSKRIDDMIAALKSKGVPVLWVGLPAIRGPRSTSDMSYLDELFRASADKAGIVYVDIWDGFVDESGRYAVQGPDFEGQTRRLRTGDGVHFTKAGAVKLANYVEHELRRVMSSHVAPVALPAPEEQSPAKGGGAGPRPAAGPVLPLTATAGGEQGDLLGAGSRPAPGTPDPIAASVLSRGDALPAAAGRADDFSWPRPGADANSVPEAPEPATLTPSVSAKRGAARNDAKSDAKNKPAPASDAPAARTRRSPSAGRDGAATTAR